jgi:ABC-type nitrate/sulfonate/bicarbonate transport system substrate-binding protein
MRLSTCLKSSTLGSLALAAMLALSTAASAETADRFQPAAPEPGTDIPAATIKFGMRPYADNTFYIIGMKKGWFDEASNSSLRLMGLRRMTRMSPRCS